MSEYVSGVSTCGAQADTYKTNEANIACFMGLPSRFTEAWSDVGFSASPNAAQSQRARHQQSMSISQKMLRVQR